MFESLRASHLSFFLRQQHYPNYPFTEIILFAKEVNGRANIQENLPDWKIYQKIFFLSIKVIPH